MSGDGFGGLGGVFGMDGRVCGRMTDRTCIIDYGLDKNHQGQACCHQEYVAFARSGAF